MCAIGHTLELAGIMTTGISLVRENAASLKPPRTLWVPFPLGRPLGQPNDAEFQHRVIAAALKLLEHDRGPVLEDFPEDAPTADDQSAEDQSAPACPVSFPRLAANDTWKERLLGEFAMLKPWYDLGRRRRRGRTLVGVSGLSIDENLGRLGDYLDRGQLPANELRWFKAAIEDAKIYYLEALIAQPGNRNGSAVHETLWHETQFGAGLARFHHRFRAHPALRAVARMVLPRRAVGGTTGDEPDMTTEQLKASS